jgi:hypothetical protein
MLGGDNGGLDEEAGAIDDLATRQDLTALLDGLLHGLRCYKRPTVTLDS